MLLLHLIDLLTDELHLVYLGLDCTGISIGRQRGAGPSAGAGQTQAPRELHTLVLI